MPPYVIDDKELETLLSALTQTVAEEVMGR
jgi:adenosylmethionine-8-amino-7-oxononanoate aminotransferase